MPRPRNMHAVKDVGLYKFAYSDEKVVSSNLNNNGLKPGKWKRKLKLEAEAVLFLWKQKRKNSTVSAST